MDSSIKELQLFRLMGRESVPMDDGIDSNESNAMFLKQCHLACEKHSEIQTLVCVPNIRVLVDRQVR